MTQAASKIKILAIVGPTASGKSALAVTLAKELCGEVVSCDSMQIYRRMDIGTAKPTPGEMDGVPHHMIDVVDPDTPYSCAEYVAQATEVIRQIDARGHLPILCGGTGLYLDSLLRGGFSEAEGDPILRERLFAFAAEYGNHALHERLRSVDPESADAIHENNVKRVVRALEIFETTGMTKTEADRRTRMRDSQYDAAVVGLFYSAREVLYSRIDRRVDAMLEQGLLEETRTLLSDGIFESNTTAAQAIGYKELLGYLRGEQSLADATQALKMATRRYAKRQITWFGAKDYVRRLEMTADGVMRDTDDIKREALAFRHASHDAANS